MKHTLPKYVEKEILKSYSNCADSFWFRGYKNTTDKLNDWLTKNFSLTSCANHTVVGSHEFAYDWKCGRWMVK